MIEVYAFRDQVVSLTADATGARSSLSQVESKNEQLRDTNHWLFRRVDELQKDVNKGVKDITDVLSKWYATCYDRLSAA